MTLPSKRQVMEQKLNRIILTILQFNTEIINGFLFTRPIIIIGFYVL